MDVASQTAWRNSPLSSACLPASIVETPIHSPMSCVHLFLGLPLPLLPSHVPSKNSFSNVSCCLTHWRPIPIHYRDRSFLHCRPIPIVYRDQFNIFFLFRTIPDTVSGLGFSVCYLLLSFHSKFRSDGEHSFYFTKLLRNPTQLDKLLLTISKWQRIEANCWRISVKI